MILIELPPNFEQILKAFPNADKPGVIFAYGHIIYNPSGVNIPRPLLDHEGVHQRRQQELNANHTDMDGVALWWDRYLTNAEFRYHEELLAHVAEFKAQAPGIDRNRRAQLLMSTAARLVAPLYNYQPPRSLTQAKSDIWELT